MALRCLLFGHDWDMEPPWTGKEIRYRPSCQRCGHEPNNLIITGPVHRTPGGSE